MTPHRQITIINAHPRTRIRHAPVIAAVERTLDGEEIGEAVINVIFVSDDELLDMNRRFLDHNYFTDVITFPLEVDPLEGEIYISVDRAREQALEHGVGVYNELMRLAIHGALHLAGYDDADQEQRARMRQLEDRYLRVEEGP